MPKGKWSEEELHHTNDILHKQMLEAGMTLKDLTYSDVTAQMYLSKDVNKVVVYKDYNVYSLTMK